MSFYVETHLITGLMLYKAECEIHDKSLSSMPSIGFDYADPNIDDL